MQLYKDLIEKQGHQWVSCGIRNKKACKHEIYYSFDLLTIKRFGLNILTYYLNLSLLNHM